MSFSIPTNEGAQFAIRYYSLASPPSQPDKLILLMSTSDRGSWAPTIFLHGKKGTRFNLRVRTGVFVYTKIEIVTFYLSRRGLGSRRVGQCFTPCLNSRSTRTSPFFGDFAGNVMCFTSRNLEELASRYPNFSFVIVLSQVPNHLVRCEGSRHAARRTDSFGREVWLCMCVEIKRWSQRLLIYCGKRGTFQFIARKFYEEFDHQ